MKAIKISTVRKDEPLLTVAETPEGIRVVEGDESMLDRLGLTKYHDLNGILRGVHRSSELRATELEIPDEGVAQKSPEAVPQTPAPGPEVAAIKIQEFEEKLKSPLEVLKAVWEKFRDHAQLRAKEAQTEEDLKGAQENPAPEEPFEGIYYVSYDGDNIGKKTQAAEEKDDEKILKDISESIRRGGQAAKDWATQFGGEVVEQGGDEGLLKVPALAMKHLEDFRRAYKQVVKANLTVGVGQTLAEATKARELGKLRGKNCVVHYDASTDQELQLRLDQDPDKKEEEPAQEKEWSMKHFDEQASPVAVEQMIKELVEEGIKNPEEIESILADHGLDDFPGVDQLIEAALGKKPGEEQSEPA